MLGKQLAIGSTPASLVVYLFGPGRANEHSQQRLVAGSDSLVATFASVDLAEDREAQNAFAREFDGRWRQARRERGLPLDVDPDENVRGAVRGDRVFHAVISLGPKDGSLTDDEWADVAREWVAEMDFIKSKEGADCPWFAVNHGESADGNDHLHIAVNLVREDGRRASVHQSKRRTAQATARIAAKLGKDVVFDEGRSSGIGNIPRAEIERGQREHRDADRLLVRRRLAAAASQATSEADFVRTARAMQLHVRPRYENGGTHRVGGYTAAVADGKKPIWFAPSRLDRALGLPYLRTSHDWGTDAQSDAVAAWKEHPRASEATKTVRLPKDSDIEKARRELLSQGEHMKWQRAASDLSAALGAWSFEAEGSQGGHLARASDALSRASQPPYGRGKRALAEGAGLIMTTAAAASKNDTAGSLAVIATAVQMLASIREALDAQQELRQASAQLERASASLRAEHGSQRTLKRERELAAMPEETRDVMQLVYGGPRAKPRRSAAPSTPRPETPRPHTTRTQEPDRGRNEE